MSDNNSSNIGWFIAGLSLGVAGTILYAPQSGHMTRKIIMRRMVEGKAHLVELGHEAGSQVNKFVDRGKAAIERQKDQIAAVVDAGRQAVHEATSKS